LTEPRTSRGLYRRLLRHYLPLALPSAVVLVLFMTLPRFDSGKQVDIFRRTFPKDSPAGQSGPMQLGGGQAPQQGGVHEIPPEILEQIPEEHRSQIQGLSPTAEEVEDRSFERRLTTATLYVALGLLALTLLIGPANLLLRCRNPVSSYLRRDVGAWTAVFSAAHVVNSLKVHGSGQIRDSASLDGDAGSVSDSPRQVLWAFGFAGLGIYGLSSRPPRSASYALLTGRFLGETEGEGFEPSGGLTTPSDFRDRLKSADCRPFSRYSPVNSPARLGHR
jgi:hypothetical protein